MVHRWEHKLFGDFYQVPLQRYLHHLLTYQFFYRLIEDLQSLGINVSDIKKLQDAGLHTIGGLLVSTSSSISVLKKD